MARLTLSLSAPLLSVSDSAPEEAALPTERAFGGDCGPSRRCLPGLSVLLWGIAREGRKRKK